MARATAQAQGAELADLDDFDGQVIDAEITDNRIPVTVRHSIWLLGSTCTAVSANACTAGSASACLLQEKCAIGGLHDLDGHALNQSAGHHRLPGLGQDDAAEQHPDAGPWAALGGHRE